MIYKTKFSKDFFPILKFLILNVSMDLVDLVLFIVFERDVYNLSLFIKNCKMTLLPLLKLPPKAPKIQNTYNITIFIVSYFAFQKLKNVFRYPTIIIEIKHKSWSNDFWSKTFICLFISRDTHILLYAQNRQSHQQRSLFSSFFLLFVIFVVVVVNRTQYTFFHTRKWKLPTHSVSKCYFLCEYKWRGHGK